MSKKMMILLFAVIICLSLAGCSLQDKIGDYSREQCYLNKENVTQFSYKGNDYTILADTVSNSGLGEWIGYIRQLAAVDESGKILLQENLKTATFQTLADLADLVDKAPNDAYIIPFLNVYAAPNADDYLIVDINGEYHKAVIDENIKGTDTVFDFKDIEQSMSGKFEINPQNAPQLLCDGTVYQVTSDTVSNNELGSYIGILAENVIFNAETKIPLSKEELRKIDWYGENAGQHREQWIYKDICNGVQREHNKKLNNGLPILHKVPPKRDYGRYFCIMAEKGGTSHGGLTEKLSLFFHAKKQEVNAYGR